MQERVTTSFIPKESLSTERATPRLSKGNPFVLLNLVAGVILGVALLGSAGVFLFKAYTESNISSKQESLARQRAAFEPATIEELSRVDRRLDSGLGLLQKHVASSLLFTELEGRTMASVRFKDFSFEPGQNGSLKLSLNGIAKSFNAVALQSDAFGKSSIIKDPIFSNVNIDASGNVTFNFEADVAHDRITYAAVVGGALPETVVEPAPTDEAEPTPPTP